MASIKLKHSSGNGTILNSPAANPSSDITLKLPSTTGSAGQVLKVASANHSSTNAELEFAADAGGKILQVVQGSTTTYTATTNSSSYIDSTLSGTITPTAASSKILVQISQSVNLSVSSYNTGIYLRLLEGSNVIYTPEPSASSQSFYFFFGGGNNSATVKARWNLVYLHTPSYSLGNTLTYKTQQKAYTDGDTTSARTQPSSDPSYIILSEVAA